MTGLPGRQPEPAGHLLAADGETGLALHGLSALAAQRFASTEEAVDAVLAVISEQIGARSSFLTRVRRDARQSEVVAAFNAAGGCDVRPGSVFALPETF